MVVNVKCWMEKVDVPNGYLKKKRNNNKNYDSSNSHVCSLLLMAREFFSSFLTSKLLGYLIQKQALKLK